MQKIGLFGSYVRDEQNFESDIDILVEFEPEKKNYDNFARLSDLLEDFNKKLKLLRRPYFCHIS
ncbi:MAG: nucleotidyltransferase domain-containing protein [candidate division KSB1 bacterium]|nr:nucleotidyltransferase domain-containing protein [candidate division KSB1 bacterium]